MNRFNVLDRQLLLHQHYLVEASAGTGKTFSIQNIAVRLLIDESREEGPILLPHLLIVTFTRAATRDLKTRVRANIESALSHLNHWLYSTEIAAGMPDYLQAVIERGEAAAIKAKKRLQHALFTFDQAQIFTIHAFCARMLKQFAVESDLGLHAVGGEDPMPTSQLLAIMRDFFRTEIRFENYSPNQLEKFLSMDPDQKKLIDMAYNNYEVIQLPSFIELFEQFCTVMQALKQSLSLETERLMADFNLQAASYKNYGKDTKAETAAKIMRFANLFDKGTWSKEDFDSLIKDDLVWVQALDPSLAKKSPPPLSSLHYPHLTEKLKAELEPLVTQAKDGSYLFARLTKDFKAFVNRFKNEEERLSPDDFLVKMHGALSEATFLKHVRDKYQAVIIDEFQDTDPLQWEIFQKAFLPLDKSWKGYLYLVGDPKQSIYSFRQADIYTYLKAALTLGKERCYSLDVNYRSHPPLVEALNTLFHAEQVPDFMPLPKRSISLAYQPVKAIERPSILKEDGIGAIHFIGGDAKASQKPKIEEIEKLVFFPFISQEILRLKQENQLNFSQFAVLVRDRHQALRLAEHFDQQGIPYLNQRQTSLINSPALTSLIDLLRALLFPKDRSAIKAALGSPLLGWNYEEVKKLEQLEHVAATIYYLRACLIEKGMAIFFQEFLQSTWQREGKTVRERLLEQERGSEFFYDLQQIVDLIIEHQHIEWNSPEGIIPFLDRLREWDDEDHRLKRIQDQTVDSVKILTLHYSKGLEFDIVFALGLMNRRKVNDQLIPVENDNQTLLVPVTSDPQALEFYCEENDAEKMRQLYVALTRAKYRLYIPLLQNFPADNLQTGEASPIELFLARFENLSLSYQALYEQIRLGASSKLTEFIDRIGKNHYLTYSTHTQVNVKPIQNLLPNCSPSLVSPPALSFKHPAIFMTSFSRLNQDHPVASAAYLKEPFPHDYNHPNKTVYNLPANAETGLLIHALLQKIDFQNFREIQNPQEAAAFIYPLIQYTNYKEWGEAIASLLYQGLKTNLRNENNPLCLANLQPGQFYREMPFLYPFERDLAIEGWSYANGLIKGVVDLIFSDQNRYYVVDWKTNWLGNKLEDYETPKLALSMHQQGYEMQAKIYQEALKRYLKIIDPRPFEECFGGIYYLYLRGMSVGSSTGIFYQEL